MFICAICNKPSEPREKPVVIITATRPRSYEVGYDDVRHGHEIVKSIQTHATCTEQPTAKD